MSLAVRVIPVLLKRGNSLVKGKQFESWRVVGHALQAARIHAIRGVDELILLDIDGKIDLKMVEKLTESCFMPVTVGGGVKSVQDVRDLLSAGADKVAVCTHAPNVVSEAAAKFGRQAICVGVDALNGLTAIRCGTTPIPFSPLDWAKNAEMEGAGEILLQSVTRDGMMQGYDLELVRAVSDAVGIPVVASCGCGSYQDMVDAVHSGASAVAAGAFFQFTNNTPKEAAEYLKKSGIEAR